MNGQDLRGQSAIVTGAGTGIGKGVALALTGAGVKVVLNGRRQEPLEETAAEIRKEGGEALVVPGDVSQEDDVIRVVNNVFTRKILPTW